MTNQRNPRRGLTLLEVIVATAIFLIAVGALGQLANISTDRALDVSLQTRTSLRCQSKLAEIMIGAETSTSGGYSDFPGDLDKDLQWRAELGDGGATGLMLAKVWVKAELPSGKIVESQLSQMYLDPAIRGTTFDQANPQPVGTPTVDGGAPSTPTPTAPPKTTTPKTPTIKKK